MGRLSEYDHVEREALRKGISRQPDPLPRGAVVAGEDRELEVVAWRDRYVRPSGSKGSWSLWELERECGPAPEYEREPLTPLLPAQERIRALEARLEQEVVERRLKESALARVRELEAAVAEMGARLERVRGVVGAAVKMAQETDFAIPGDKEAWKSILDVEKFVDALTPEDREWAEAEET